MIAFVKTLVSRLLFNNKSKKKFIASRLSPNDIPEQAFLLDTKQETDITWQHCIVCHEPFLLAVWMQSDKNPTGEGGRLVIRKNRKVAAEASLRLKHSINFQGNWVLVYNITAAECHQLPYWRQYILQKRYFLYKKKDTFLQGMIYAALYSFPRRVIAVSYRDHAYYNIFPMDFQCFVESAGVMLLGLRTTNTTLKKILASRKVVVSDTTSVNLKTIYDLGRNHSSAPPPVDQLPFGVIESDKFGFYVPDFAATYKEFEIVEFRELGTHTMMIGTLVNSKTLRDDQSYIHHVHFFEFAESEMEELI